MESGKMKPERADPEASPKLIAGWIRWDLTKLEAQRTFVSLLGFRQDSSMVEIYIQLMHTYSDLWHLESLNQGA